jgi:serine/threonine-protein kinase
MTVAGTMMGTPSYMSPEQVQGGAITGAADQFSLAVVAYEALTGEKPFVAEYLPTLLYKIVREDPLPPQRLNPTLGSQVEAVLRKGLAKSAGSRYESCVDFVAALTAACNSAPGWTPLPRGVSQNMPTVGSQEGLSATVAERLDETIADASPAEPLPPPAPPKAPRAPKLPPPPVMAQPPPPPAPMAETPAPLPPPRDPYADREPSHAVRNILLAAVGAAVVGIAIFVIAHQNRTTPQPTASAPPSAAPARETAAPAPETKSAAPQPPPARPVEPPPQANAADPPPVKTVPAAPRTPPGPSQFAFELTATPAGATAVFDNDSSTQCAVPCTLNLNAGRHTFNLKHPGYRDAQRIIEIPRDSGLIVNLEPLSGMLSLSTNPPGLTVIIDGQEQSKKTPATFSLAPGSHRVDVVKGSDKQELSVDISDGGTAYRTVNWAQ